MSLYTKIIDLQKLNIAWNKVRKNKPAAGVDNISYEMFEERKRVELRQLQLELQGHTYEALPVKEVVLYKGEKARSIALYSMRDKVVQQAIAAELNVLFDKYFSIKDNRFPIKYIQKITFKTKDKMYGKCQYEFFVSDKYYTTNIKK